MSIPTRIEVLSGIANLIIELRDVLNKAQDPDPEAMYEVAQSLASISIDAGYLSQVAQERADLEIDATIVNEMDEPLTPGEAQSLAGELEGQPPVLLLRPQRPRMFKAELE